jgi:hypothetical protein
MLSSASGSSGWSFATSCGSSAILKGTATDDPLFVIDKWAFGANPKTLIERMRSNVMRSIVEWNWLNCGSVIKMICSRCWLYRMIRLLWRRWIDTPSSFLPACPRVIQNSLLTHRKDSENFNLLLLWRLGSFTHYKKEPLEKASLWNSDLRQKTEDIIRVLARKHTAYTRSYSTTSQYCTVPLISYHSSIISASNFGNQR